MCEELKPCPFCGGEAWVNIDDTNIRMTYSVECKNVNCRAYFMAWSPTEAKAIAIWNLRAPVKPEPEPASPKLLTSGGEVIAQLVKGVWRPIPWDGKEEETKCVRS